MNSRVTLDINLDILAENFQKISSSVAPLKTIVTLKANAYGLGVRPIAKRLAHAGAAAIATAELSEALAVTDLNLPVLILGTLLPSEIKPAIQAGIRIPLAGLHEAIAINACAQKLGKTAICHLAVDTGMGRVGIQLNEALDVIPKIAKLQNITLEGMYSHFPMAYVEDDAGTPVQISAYQKLACELATRGITIPWMHIANSDAINNFPETACVSPFTHARTGINLYGSFDIIGNRRLHLRPVLTLHAKLAQVRTLTAGRTIGYGRTFTCPQNMRVGTVAAGYADGLPLALSNRGYLLVRGHRCPVIGRISMDYTTINLDGVPDSIAGDPVICLGSEHPEANSVESWAELKGTHPYEVICSIGSRVERNHITIEN